MTDGKAVLTIFDVDLKLTGHDGNAFMILGLAQETAKEAGIDKDLINEYVNEATSSDYNHLLKTTMEYFNVY